jgi:DNA-binding transcriptional LysR family regulator
MRETVLNLYEALEALKKTGTMGQAGAYLRISQSAVSKRIAALETTTKKKLIEKNGRRVYLTAEAEQLINKISPLLADIRNELNTVSTPAAKELHIGISESVLASWGAKVLWDIEHKLNPTQINPHAHRGPLLTQLVGSGTYLAGIIAGEPGALGSIECVQVGKEQMVILECNAKIDTLISIESQSATWQSIKRKSIKLGLVPDRFVESFFSAASLAIAGFGSALLPQGVVESLKLPRSANVKPVAGLFRPIHLIGRKHILVREEIVLLRKMFERKLGNEST